MLCSLIEFDLGNANKVWWLFTNEGHHTKRSVHQKLKLNRLEHSLMFYFQHLLTSSFCSQGTMKSWIACCFLFNCLTNLELRVWSWHNVASWHKTSIEESINADISWYEEVNQFFFWIETQCYIIFITMNKIFPKRQWTKRKSYKYFTLKTKYFCISDMLNLENNTSCTCIHARTHILPFNGHTSEAIKRVALLYSQNQISLLLHLEL